MTVFNQLLRSTVANFGDIPENQRDAMALAFWMGAWVALHSTADPITPLVGKTLSLIRTGGYQEIADLMADEGNGWNA